MWFSVKETNFLDQFGQLLQESFKKKSLTDVRINCRGNTFVMANRTILALRSAFFEENFLKDAVDFIEVEAETMESVLEYVYSGRTSVHFSNLASFRECSTSESL